MTASDALAFIEQHGIVLEAGRGPAPSLAEYVAGGPIKRSWWVHPKASEIFAITRSVRGSPDVLTCRLVQRKVTFVHRRLWPAIVRLSSILPSQDLAALREDHTRTGAHRVVSTPFPRWVPDATRISAREMALEDARSQLEPLLSILRAGSLCTLSLLSVLESAFTL
jgi:hypothetical protein